ncbi:hypothetical protein H0H93_015761, partial [Arthromyces matolae]
NRPRLAPLMKLFVVLGFIILTSLMHTYAVPAPLPPSIAELEAKFTSEYDAMAIDKVQATFSVLFQQRTISTPLNQEDIVKHVIFASVWARREAQPNFSAARTSLQKVISYIDGAITVISSSPTESTSSQTKPIVAFLRNKRFLFETSLFAISDKAYASKFGDMEIPELFEQLSTRADSDFITSKEGYEWEEGSHEFLVIMRIFVQKALECDPGKTKEFTRGVLQTGMEYTSIISRHSSDGRPIYNLAKTLHKEIQRQGVVPQGTLPPLLSYLRNQLKRGIHRLCYRSRP